MFIFPKALSLSLCSFLFLGGEGGLGKTLIIKVSITTFMLKTSTFWAINILSSKLQFQEEMQTGHLHLTTSTWPGWPVICPTWLTVLWTSEKRPVAPQIPSGIQLETLETLGVVRAFNKYPLKLKAWLWPVVLLHPSPHKFSLKFSVMISFLYIFSDPSKAWIVLQDYQFLNYPVI